MEYQLSEAWRDHYSTILTRNNVSSYWIWRLSLTLIKMYYFIFNSVRGLLVTALCSLVVDWKNSKFLTDMIRENQFTYDKVAVPFIIWCLNTMTGKIFTFINIKVWLTYCQCAKRNLSKCTWDLLEFNKNDIQIFQVFHSLKNFEYKKKMICHIPKWSSALLYVYVVCKCEVEGRTGWVFTSISDISKYFRIRHYDLVNEEWQPGRSRKSEYFCQFILVPSQWIKIQF